MHRLIILSIILIWATATCQSQEVAHQWQQDAAGGQLVKITSANSPFPDSLRKEGHSYGEHFYPAAQHYQDSTVAIFIPPGFEAQDKTDLLFYFHGWWNNIDSSMATFRLTEQFAASGRNAVFVFPEGPKNAPDSYGGKLEEAGRFKSLVKDVLAFLQHEQKIKTADVGDITLAGHSGAYRVMGFILKHGGLTDHINEVFLFDGLYGQFDSYADWVVHNNVRFINITTSNAGTWQNSNDFLRRLDSLSVPYYRIKGNEAAQQQLSANRIVFIFSSLGHNDVIDPSFGRFLQFDYP